jgi:hypothetical protein
MAYENTSFTFTSPEKYLKKPRKVGSIIATPWGWVSNEGGYDSRPRKTPCLSQTFVNTSDSSTYWDVFDLSCDLGIPHSHPLAISCHLLPSHFSILPLFVVVFRITHVPSASQEYVLLSEENDSDLCATQLGKLLAPRARKATGRRPQEPQSGR